ncbi:FG-GAP repeat domain-containing protein [Geobacter pickeringii]|uniref:VCBS repeat-containing protein n=1 Tax=Geobacter pickeringii TaxID=345632 RepID=A0A0B5BKA0_9BACT|nr:VCBS repeat-containing protein [Geobacter pickeringii]AJE04486.1 hypothetical protein GPICK_14950 [Geobacter pickeringii]
MKKIAIIVCSLLLVALTIAGASAAPIRAYVAEFSVTGAANKDELKTTLQTLLASRLSGEKIISVDSPSGADLLVKGSYIVFGKVFSIDAVAKDAGGRVIARAFQQGENQDELIPAVGKLGQALASELTAKVAVSPPPAAARMQTPAPSATPDIIRSTATAAAPEIIRPQEPVGAPTGSWVSQRLGGALIGMAPGRIGQDGSQEYYLVEEHTLRLYRKHDGLKLVAEVSFSPREKVLAVDSADLDGDGIPEIYLTVMDGETLASQVWVATNDSLKRVAANLPYFFRGIALDGKERRIYVQQMSTDQDFYGDVFELVKNGDRFETKNPIKLPRFGNLYNFNRFTDSSGELHYVVLNSDGYLVVYSAAGEEIWRSSDKLGGSETHFKREDISHVQTTGVAYRWVFLEQRITVAPGGDIMIPQNSGFFVVGYNRAYTKNSIYCFTWNGSSLDERWHTKISQNYLADYGYDPARKELTVLEVAKKEGVFTSGASVLAIKKVE